ncbi:MAG: hypothetical protein ABMA13_16085 [Chthoniobacteraceae bacterium]
MMSPTAFCRLALRIFPDLPLNDVADLVKPECLPDWSDVATRASEMADSITPSIHTLPAHIRLYEVSEWAAEQIGKAVAA